MQVNEIIGAHEYAIDSNYCFKPVLKSAMMYAYWRSNVKRNELAVCRNVSHLGFQGTYPVFYKKNDGGISKTWSSSYHKHSIMGSLITRGTLGI